MKTITLILAVLISLTAFNQTFFYDTPTGILTDSQGNNVDGQTFSTCANETDVVIYISNDSSAVNPLTVSFQNADQVNTVSTTYSLYDLNFNWTSLPPIQFSNWIMPTESGTMVFTSGTNQVSMNFVSLNDIDQSGLITDFQSCPGSTFSFDPTTYGALNVSSWYVFSLATGATLFPNASGVVELDPVPYELTMINVNGCQSTALINVNEAPPSTGVVNVSICPGDQYTSPQGNNYTAGTYTEIYVSSIGCDSTVTINVNEFNIPNTFTTVSVCPGTDYVSPQGNTYSTGTYTETYTSAIGCDSLVTFNVVEFSDTLLNISFVNPTGCGYNDGQILLNNLLADSTYCVYFDNDTTGIKDTYIADGSGVIMIDGLGSGVYQNFMMQNPCGINIYDSTTIITLTDPLPITPIVTATQDTICIDLAESTTLNVTNSNDYTFIEWMPVNAPNPFTTFAGGTYIANVLDVNNCPTVSNSITIIAVDVCDTNTNSIQELQLEPIKTEYYNLLGQKIKQPVKGTYFEVTTYTNGSQTSKMLYK